MRTMKFIKSAVQVETEGLGYVLGALITAQPTNIDQLKFFLAKIKADTKALDQGFDGESAAYSVASNLLKGVEDFERSELWRD